VQQAWTDYNPVRGGAEGVNESRHGALLPFERKVRVDFERCFVAGMLPHEDLR
jgi:hypothetical protein